MWNFAVMKSVLGDYWVGKTKLEADEISIFSTWEAAINRAIELNDSIENLHELQEAEEEDVEEIRKEMEKWIVR